MSVIAAGPVLAFDRQDQRYSLLNKAKTTLCRKTH